MSTNPIKTMRSHDSGAMLKPAWEDYFERQIEATRRQVLWSEIAAGGILVLVWSLAIFLLAILIDGWVIALGEWARWLLLALLTAGAVMIALRFIAPFLFRRISAEFAAKMIEDGNEGFHNSLLNYLFLRKKSDQVSVSILQSVGERAARDIATVSPMEKVDYGRAIRLSLVLLALFGIFAVYVLVSPKSPWPTIQRILWPAADIPRPSTVTISQVHPGHAEVVFGQKLLVTAEIRGRHDPRAVRLFYTTTDGQQVGVGQVMRPEGDSHRYQLELATSPAGIQHDVQYWIEAHDGRSSVYQVTVLTNPTITVDAVEIIPPAYTELPPRRLEGRGDVEGPEGSLVKVFAKSNLPISVAYVELLRARPGDPVFPFDVIRTIELTRTNDYSASGQFYLVMDTQVLRPMFTHYQVKFRSLNDRRSELVNVYPVRMIPDLPPEVKIVRPTLERLGLPVNREMEFEAVAMDRDYKLSAFEFLVDHQGGRFWRHSCDLPAERNQQLARGTFRLSPQELQLRPGDELIVFARAADNRVSLHSNQLDPNVARSQNVIVLIEEPSVIQPPPVDQSQSKEQTSDAKQPTEETNRDPAHPTKNTDQGAQEAGDSQTADGRQHGEKHRPNDGNSEDLSRQHDQPQNANNAGNRQPHDRAGSTPPPTDHHPSNQQQTNNETGQDSQNNQTQQEQQQQEQSEAKAHQSNPSASENQGTGRNESSGNTNPSRGNGEGQSPDAGQRSPEGRSQPSGQENDGSAKDDSPGQRGATSSGGGENGEQSTPLDRNATDGQRIERLHQLAQQSRQPTDRDSTNPTAGEPPQEAKAGQRANQKEGDDRNGSQSGARSESSDPSRQDVKQGDNQSIQNDSHSGDASAKTEQRQANAATTGLKDSDQQATDSTKENPGQRSDRAPEGSKDDPAAQGSQADAQTEEGASDAGKTAQDRGARNQSNNDRNQQIANGQRTPENEQAQGNRSGQDEQRPSESNQAGLPNPNEQGSSTDPNRDSNSLNQGGAGARSTEHPPRDGSRPGTEGDPRDETPQERHGRQPGDANQEDSQADRSASAANSSASSGSSANERRQTPGQDDDAAAQGEASAAGADSAATNTDQAHQGMSAPAGDSRAGEPDPAASSGTGMGRPGTARAPGGASSTGAPQAGSTEPSREDLEYSRAATDMVLNYLREQQHNPDPKLLESMNWTADDLRDFLNRWEEMRRRAQVDESGRQQYEEALQSLGLRRPDPRRQSARGTQQGRQGLGEEGAVLRPPAQYAEQFNAFMKHVNRMRDDKE